MPNVVNIPGGTATFRDPKSLAVKHRRPVQVLVGVLGQDRAAEVAQAMAAGGRLDDLGLNEREFDLLLRMNEATLFALLESWTITDPLPQTAADVGEMNGQVYDALISEAAGINADLMAADAGFGVGAVEDPTSPTGASAGSTGRSAAVARRAPSDRAKPRGGRSTATGGRSPA